MKRFIIIAALVCVAVIAILFFLRFEDRRVFSLSTGATATVLKVAVGPHDLESVKPFWWVGIASRLPRKLRNSLVYFLPAMASGGSGRNWIYVPDDTNDLQIYLRLDHSNLAPSTFANDIKGSITDADGWVWESHAHGYRTFGLSPSNQINVISLSFAGFPRWEREFDVRLVLDGMQSGKRSVTEIGHIKIKNPEIQNPTNLTPRPLPQIVQTASLTVQLEKINYRPHPPWPAVSSEDGEHIGGVTTEFTAREATDQGVVIGAWHEVHKTIVDEYGNNSFYGLPARRPTDVNAPVKAWQLGLELVGDQRSQMASNSFYPLAGQPFPENGRLLTELPISIQNRLTNCAIDAVYVMGAGGVQFTNDVVETNYVVKPSTGGVAESYGSRSASSAPGQMIPFVKLESRSPFIVAHVNGVTDGIWFSCRAKNSETGESLWLSQYASPTKTPSFRPSYNQPQLVWWSADKLDTNVVWSFEIGAHYPTRMEFVVDRPKWNPGKSGSTGATSK